MKITFLGAAQTVTGSCYLVETAQASFLVDCGMFQGKAALEQANDAPFQFHPGRISFLLLTHAHIDHSGRIPKLWADGYRNPVYSTKATADLCGVMLPDSGHIQEMEAEWDNRKRQRAGSTEVVPLYTQQDAMDSLKLFSARKYDESFSPAPGVRVAFRDAGHILGSAIIELWVQEDGKETKIVFSGDLGYKNRPILRDPALIADADLLVVESTYGDRLHENPSGKADRLIGIINDTAARGGNVVIPAFAVERTQELVYEMNMLLESGNSVGAFAKMPVYIDSPLAVSATQIFRENMDCFDEEAQRVIATGDNPLDFRNLHYVKTVEESKRLNEDKQSKIILSASGMCDAGRIKHHLKHNLWRKESTIVFVGYQAEGTLGRRLVDGARNVKIFGEDIRVNARIEKIDGYSGHADRDALLGWIGSFTKKPGRIVLVHGEASAIKNLSGSIRERFGVEAEVPALGGSIDVGAAKAATAVAKPPAGLGKPTVLQMINTLRDEFSSKMNALQEDLMKSGTDGDINRVVEKVKELGKRISQ